MRSLNHASKCSFPRSAKALKLVRDPDLRRLMGSVSAKKIAGHTQEKWAEDFENIIEKVIGK